LEKIPKMNLGSARSTASTQSIVAGGWTSDFSV